MVKKGGKSTLYKSNTKMTKVINYKKKKAPVASVDKTSRVPNL